jgi:HTH-type transcriptional regulator/antitoxin HipB
MIQTSYFGEKDHLMDRIARTTKDLGNVLREARKIQNLTQADLAARAGIWQRTVSNIETSASGAKVDTIFDLLAALDLELHIVPRSKMTPGDLEDIF